MSEKKYAFTVSFIVFDIPKWTLRRGSDMNSPYISGSLFCRLKTACIKNNPPSERNYTNNISLQFNQVPFLSSNVICIHALIYSHQLDAFVSYKPSLFQLFCIACLGHVCHPYILDMSCRVLLLQRQALQTAFPSFHLKYSSKKDNQEAITYILPHSVNL